MLEESANAYCTRLQSKWPTLHQSVRKGVLSAWSGSTAGSSNVLCFDGGARQPWNRGVGALMVSHDDTTAESYISWMDSVELGFSPTTYNVAEYKGFLYGHRKDTEFKLSAIHVVGDSRLIIRQMTTKTSPATRHLQVVYRQCAALAARILVVTWSNHLRHFNQAANRLANRAMDTRRSVQVARALRTPFLLGGGD